MTAHSAPSPERPDADRAIGDLLRLGVVRSVDLDAGKVVVAIGDQETPPSDWLMTVGDTTVWIPPTVGQQVLVLCPEADVDQAIVLNGLPSSAFSALFLGLKAAIRFADGAQVDYDPEAAALRVQTPGKVTVVAPGGVAIEGDVGIVGDLSVDGNVSATGTANAAVDVVGAGKSLKGHKHTGGTIDGQTGAPV